MNSIIRRMASKRNNKGFSLIELIIVIAIMAVLTAVLAPQLIKYVERSRMAKDIQNIAAADRVLQLAVVDPPASFVNGLSNGNLHYLPCGCMRGVGSFLAGEFTDAFGPTRGQCALSDHSTNYRMPELTSKFYKSKTSYLTGDNNNWNANMATTWKFLKGTSNTLDMKWFHTWDPYTGNAVYKSGVFQN